MARHKLEASETNRRTERLGLRKSARKLGRAIGRITGFVGRPESTIPTDTTTLLGESQVQPPAEQPPVTSNNEAPKAIDSSTDSVNIFHKETQFGPVVDMVETKQSGHPTVNQAVGVAAVGDTVAHGFEAGGDVLYEQTRRDMERGPVITAQAVDEASYRAVATDRASLHKVPGIRAINNGAVPSRLPRPHDLSHN